MQVQVKLYATLVQVVSEAVIVRYDHPIRAGTPLPVELPAGSTLADLVNDLGLPREKVRVAFVNGRARGMDYCLEAGDEVGIFPPVGGG
jgi:molybdopterin synthase sulfur carrier subunit